jgi:hypothetical protein
MNDKAEFAVKILLEYAKENGINGRDTTDLSPLEKWLIIRLFVCYSAEEVKWKQTFRDLLAK